VATDNLKCKTFQIVPADFFNSNYIEQNRVWFNVVFNEELTP